MNRRRKILVLSIITLLTLMLLGAPPILRSSSNIKEKTSAIVVVATTFPLYDFVRNIAGDRVELKLLIPFGREFHDWEPTFDTVEMVRGADLLVYNGAGLESWLDRLIEVTGNKALVTVNSSEGLVLITNRGGSSDAHVWLDPLNAKYQVSKIRDALMGVDGRNEEAYRVNAELYIRQLDGLHTEISETLNKHGVKDFITFHPAFSYFALRYGLKQHSIVGSDPEKEPSVEVIADVMSLVKEKGIQVIYTEPLLDPRLTHVVAEQAGLKILVLDPMDGVSEEDFRKGVSYLEKMKENLRSFVEG